MDKCVSSFMEWKKKRGKESLGSIEELPGDIKIRNGRDIPVTIIWIEAWEAEYIMGVRCALDGNDTT